MRECGIDRCVTIDLEQEYSIDKILIVNGFPAPGYEGMYFKSNIVQISTDNENWINVYDYTIDGNYLVIARPQIINLDTPTNARYVKQCMDGNNYYTYEGTWMQIEVWGDISSEVPEFTTITGIMVLIGSVIGIIIIRKK